MSDPVTNVEIEDVLSSIRRLVSSDGRPPKAAEAPVVEPAEPERLVLTPSLRIDDAAQTPATPKDEGAGDNAHMLFGEGSLDDVDDHAEPDDEDDWTDQIDAPGAHDADMLRTETVDDFDSELTALDDATDEVESDDEAGIGGSVPALDPDEDDRANDQKDNERKDRAGALKARVAELEEVVARQADQWDPDGAGSDENSGSPVSPLPWEDYAPGGDDAEAENKDAKRVIEEAITKAAETPAKPVADSPETGGADADDGDAEEIPDNFAAAEPDEADAPRGSHAPRDDEDADLFAGSDEYLDEDALRDLVADIVRQELQGALGERITRNVRKLVRREIHRALTSQELQ
ncbi:hypothetical protein ACEWPM_014545 [Roseovarius sp. S4756]|uniref:hypothetical protein n=1 Tax=Roseovarius maritimus TaxID=3342637 RepID=UPI00372A818D